MHDVQSLRAWMEKILLVTAICVTLFPLLYGLFSPWYKSRVGTALVFKSSSTALLIDYSVVRVYIFPDSSPLFNLVVYIVILVLICCSSLFFTITLLRLNFFGKENNDGREQEAVSE